MTITAVAAAIWDSEKRRFYWIIDGTGDMALDCFIIASPWDGRGYYEQARESLRDLNHARGFRGRSLVSVVLPTGDIINP